MTPSENKWTPPILGKVSHDDSGECRRCLQLFARFAGFDIELGNWFCNLQSKFKDAHISCAGRGRIEQEECFMRGASKAHFGQSAHNYNCAIDIFQLKDGTAVWDKDWFAEVVGKNINENFVWYGAPGASFYELPHVEVKTWREMKAVGLVNLVE